MMAMEGQFPDEISRSLMPALGTGGERDFLCGTKRGP